MSFAGNGAFPNSIGTFWFLLGILSPFAGKFNNRSLFFSSFVSVLAFYAKPYFALAFGIVFLYLLVFVSLKKAFSFAGVFTILFLATATLVLNTFPTYFLETMISNVSNSMLSWTHSLRQFLQLVVDLMPCLSFALLMAMHNFPNRTRWFVLPWRWQTRDRRVGVRLHLEHEFYFGFVTFCSILVVFFLLGRHVGSYMSYLYQLIVPLVVIWLFRQPVSLSMYSKPMVATLLLNLTFLFFTNLAPTLFASSIGGWERLYASMADSRVVFNNPILVSRLVDLKVPVVDSGQSEYFYWIKPYPSIGIAPDFQDVQSRGLQYLEIIETRVRQRKYEKIYITQGYSPLVSPALFSEYYDLAESFYIRMPQARQTWIIQLWVPAN